MWCSLRTASPKSWIATISRGRKVNGQQYGGISSLRRYCHVISSFRSVSPISSGEGPLQLSSYSSAHKHSIARYSMASPSPAPKKQEKEGEEEDKQSKRTMKTEDVLAKLAEYSTCEIADALVKLDIKNGGYIPDLDIYSHSDKTQVKVVGQAYTVKMVDSYDEKTPKVEQQFVDAADDGSVLVITAPPHCKNAVWGGLMSAGAKAKGIKGVIIDGRCRDLAEHRKIGLPVSRSRIRELLGVFARGHSTLGQNSFTRPGHLNEPITIVAHPPALDSYNNLFPSVTVHPRDFVIADEDGVIVLAPEKGEDVLQLVQRGREIDDKCMEAIMNGKPIGETFKKYRGK